MNLLDRIQKKYVQAATGLPPWWSALLACGWPTTTLDLITQVQQAHGPGVLRDRYPGVLEVIKAGPGHMRANRVEPILRQLAKVGPGCLPANGGEGGADGGPQQAQPWNALEAARLSYETIAYYRGAAGSGSRSFHPAADRQRWYATLGRIDEAIEREDMGSLRRECKGLLATGGVDGVPLPALGKWEMRLFGYSYDLRKVVK